jgi:hypothetical protein
MRNFLSLGICLLCLPAEDPSTMRIGFFGFATPQSVFLRKIGWSCSTAIRWSFD